MAAVAAITTNGLMHEAKSIFDERWMMTQKQKKTELCVSMWLWCGKECYIPLLALCRLVRKWSQIKKNPYWLFPRNWYCCVSFYILSLPRLSAPRCCLIVVIFISICSKSNQHLIRRAQIVCSRIQYSACCQIPTFSSSSSFPKLQSLSVLHSLSLTLFWLKHLQTHTNRCWIHFCNRSERNENFVWNHKLTMSQALLAQWERFIVSSFGVARFIFIRNVRRRYRVSFKWDSPCLWDVPCDMTRQQEREQDKHGT